MPLTHASIMTNPALAWGSAFIAFSPILSLLFFLSYPKAQLVIVVTTSAFFFLCSSLVAGLFWYLLDELIGLPGGSTIWVLLPGVLSQFLFRCAFVHVYHLVEQVIQNSLERYEQQNPPDSNNDRGNDAHPNIASIGSDQTVAVEDDDHVVDGNVRGRTPAAPAAGSSPQQQLHHWARLQLEMNDFACALAAATGFGGMHAILFYGTLLASETSLNRNSNGGTLYQPSCLNMPSLVVSAIMACFFSILDVFWMLLTFFGMRRRLLFHRSETAPGMLVEETEIARAASQRLSNSRGAGNYALLFCLVSHIAASLATTANLFTNGCVASLPLLGIVTLLTAFTYMARVHRIYLPPPTLRTVPTMGAAAATTTSAADAAAAVVGGPSRLLAHTSSDPYHRD